MFKKDSISSLLWLWINNAMFLYWAHSLCWAHSPWSINSGPKWDPNLRWSV